MFFSLEILLQAPEETSSNFPSFFLMSKPVCTQIELKQPINSGEEAIFAGSVPWEKFRAELGQIHEKERKNNAGAGSKANSPLL
jgi:hypothetical protein